MIFDKKQAIAILKRAIKTFCQTAASMITIGLGIGDLNWASIFSVSFVAFIYSILSNIGGTPEGKIEGAMIFKDGENGPVLQIKSDLPTDILATKKSINVAITDERTSDNGNLIQTEYKESEGI